MHVSSLPPVAVCRPALPIDKTDMLRVTQKIWDGNDYVPQVWDNWLSDSQGCLAVVEYAGGVRGLCKISRLGMDEWWLEGLRVQPEFEGRGLASRLHDYLISWWKTQAGGVLRLATSSKRKPVQHLADRTGFRRVAELQKHVAKAIQNEHSDFEHPDPIPAASLAMQLMNSPFTNQLLDLRWHWAVVDEKRLQKALTEGRVFLWRQGIGMLVWVPDDDEDGLGPYVCISGLDCPPDELVWFMVDCRRLAGEMGYGRIIWYVPNTLLWMDVLQAAGYGREGENELFIYARSLTYNTRTR